MRRRALTGLAGAVAIMVALGVTGCSSGGATAADGKTQLSYWIWNPAEKAEQQSCVDGFEKANPDIDVKIQQYGWQDYWNNLTTNMAADTAPDIITMSSMYFGQYANQGQLLPLDDDLKHATAKPSEYANNLATVFKGQDGKTYALPKEWSSYAMFYNSALTDAAGVTADQMANLTWNPTDGGSFEQVLAKLSVDDNGVHGDQPGFDPKHVATYGLGLLSSGDALGDVQWSAYALADGWTYANKNPWGTDFHYSDQKFKDTITWYRSLITKGYMPPLAAALSSVSTQQPYASGKYAIVTDGNFNAATYTTQMGDVMTKFASNPVGPTGKRGSLLGSNALSISAGTKYPDQAWTFVNYMNSPACQDIIAKAGTVIPSLTSSSDLTLKTMADKGIDMSAFQTDAEVGQMNPITDHWSDIVAIMMPVMDSTMGFTSDVSALDQANKHINALFAK